ncbi:MAG: right-handed parallel beta-helix repeat-containing protein [Planctomycetaceae bacterium]|nr:right-handed parallel beta-helix repeat-containing protein [Planctomycetaceae bacterium]
MTAFFVSPAGNDANSGTIESPFATLARAAAAVRQLKQPGGTCVFLRGGIYCLGESFSLTADDSGTADAPVTYRSYEGETARLVGGVVIPPAAFKPVSDPRTLARLEPAAAPHVLVADLGALGVGGIEPWADYSQGAFGAMELFVDGAPAVVARWPKEGWSKIVKVVDPEDDTRMPGRPAKPGGFVYEGERPCRWKLDEGVWASGYWCYDWSYDTMRIESIDTQNRIIRFAAPTTYGFNSDGHRRYFVHNLLEELSAPGEYYLDARRGLLYFYPAGPFGEGSCVLSTLKAPIVSLHAVSHVRLEGLTIEGGRGHGVEIVGGRGVAISECTIRNVGHSGVQVGGGVDHHVDGCEISYTGTFGMHAVAGDRRTLTPAGHQITNCHMHHFSRLQRTYAPAIQIRGVGMRAAHNLLHDGPHTVVQYHGNDLIIEYNEIHSVCGETGDVGVIGTGRDWAMGGCIVRYNFVHDISGLGPVGAVAIYVDDLGGGVTIHGNIIYKVQRGFLIGGGRQNVLTNNIVADCPVHTQLDSRALNWTPHFAEEGNDLRNNLATVPHTTPPWSTRFPLLARILDDEPAWPKHNVFRNNVLYKTAPIWVAKEFTQVSDVSDNWATDADPGFVDAENRDLCLRADAPVFNHLSGFEPIPFARIGPRKKEHRGTCPCCSRH